MNKDWIRFHLREALDELTQTITKLESGPDYSEIDLQIAMEHLYNHLNTAWNSRDVDPDRAARCSEEDFYAWRDFPSDISMRS